MTARVVAVRRGASVGALVNGRTDIDAMMVTGTFLVGRCRGTGTQADPRVRSHNPSSRLIILGSSFRSHNPDVAVMFQFVDIPALPGGMETSGGLRL
jgi:hypothetical protein